MATTIAQISLSSSDLITNALALSDAATLTIAGDVTGLTQTTGVGRTNFTNNPIQTKVIYRSDDAATNGANKIYLKNLSTNAAHYFTVYMTGDRGGETHVPANALTEIGRLYAGDWAFFPWSATSGTKEVFTCEITGTWAALDSIEFDGVTIISPGSGKNELATAISAAQYPNWTTTVDTATVTFTARHSRSDVEIDASEFTIEEEDSGTNATITVTTSTQGTKSASDIYIRPSVVTTMDLEHILFHE
tara:strand:+ start:275 stop:1018 length:744 start_codon:yes stop_codon:yes gene_type:complete